MVYGAAGDVLLAFSGDYTRFESIQCSPFKTGPLEESGMIPF